MRSSPIAQKRATLDPSYVHSLSSEQSMESSRPDMLADLSDLQLPSARNADGPSDQPIDEPTLYNQALEGFMKELGLKEDDKHLIDGCIEIQEAHPGVTILTEGKSEVILISVGMLQNLLHISVLGYRFSVHYQWQYVGSTA